MSCLRHLTSGWFALYVANEWRSSSTAATDAKAGTFEADRQSASTGEDINCCQGHVLQPSLGAADPAAR